MVCVSGGIGAGRVVGAIFAEAVAAQATLSPFFEQARLCCSTVSQIMDHSGQATLVFCLIVAMGCVCCGCARLWLGMKSVVVSRDVATKKEERPTQPREGGVHDKMQGNPND